MIGKEYMKEEDLQQIIDENKIIQYDTKINDRIKRKQTSNKRLPEYGVIRRTKPVKIEYKTRNVRGRPP